MGTLSPARPGDEVKATGPVHHNTLAGAVYEQRKLLLRRISTLSTADWDLVCPAPAPAADVVRLDAPRRTVREVVAHLVVVDDMVLGGGALRAWAGLRRLEHPGGWDLRRIAPLAQRPAAELVALLAQRHERFSRLVAEAPGAVRRLPVPGPFGRQPLAGVLGRRVLHEWLHEQDIAAAAEASPVVAMSPSVAAVATDALLRLLPEAVLPRMSLKAGVVRLVVDLTDERAAGGGVQRCIWGLDFSRRQYGPRVLAPPDATIRLAAPALAMLMYGRSERVGSGCPVDVAGDQQVADDFLSMLTTPGTAAPCPGIAEAALAS